MASWVKLLDVSKLVEISVATVHGLPDLTRLSFVRKGAEDNDVYVLLLLGICLGWAVIVDSWTARFVEQGELVFCVRRFLLGGERGGVGAATVAKGGGACTTFQVEYPLIGSLPIHTCSRKRPVNETKPVLGSAFAVPVVVKAAGVMWGRKTGGGGGPFTTTSYSSAFMPFEAFPMGSLLFTGAAPVGRSIPLGWCFHTMMSPTSGYRTNCWEPASACVVGSGQEVSSFEGFLFSALIVYGTGNDKKANKNGVWLCRVGK